MNTNTDPVTHALPPATPGGERRAYTHAATTGRHVEGAELARLGARTRLAAQRLADRARVEVAADSGRHQVDDPAEVLARPVLTLTGDTSADDVTLTVEDLAVLGELADATASSQAHAESTGSRSATARHMVPGTMRRDGRGEFSGGVEVTGAWVRAEGPHPVLCSLYVVLEFSTSVVGALPAAGVLDITGTSSDGRVTRATFRRELPDGRLADPVAANRPTFRYVPRS